MGCDLCGAQTPRNHLCKECSQMARHDEQVSADGGQPDDLLVYECQLCGGKYEAPGLEACPDCEETRAVCLGPVEEVCA